MKEKVITAYCWRNGVIGFTTPIRQPQVPEGALPICTGPAKIVKDIIGVCARHAYDGKTLLVPGLPEIELTKKDPVEVLRSFSKWVRNRPGLSRTPPIKEAA